MVGIFQLPFVVDGDDDDDDVDSEVFASSVVGNVTHSGHPVVVSGMASKPNRILKHVSSTSTLLQLAYASNLDVICCIQLLF